MASLEERTINLEEATNQILHSSNTKKPFFFIIGSGVSFPSIKSTQEIIEQCKSVVKCHNILDREQSLDLMNSYTYWFLKAFPNARDRQDFIRDLVCDKPVSGSAFRLAHILSSRLLSNTVITTNFDELIEKALDLFGVSYVSYQHPSVADQIDFEQDQIQIVHVHGTYHYYDLCNLKDEIQNRAKFADITSATIANRLDQLLIAKSPIVIGYGGWDGDVITASIKRRLYGAYNQSMQLPYNIYWFCFDQLSFDLVPDYIRDHQNVMFVIPGTKSRDNQAFIKPTILSASETFESFIRTGELNKPEITRDPLNFFANQLERIFALPETGQSFEIDDPYDILSIAHRIRRSQLRTLSNDEMILESVRDWTRVSNYGKAARLLSDLDYHLFNQEMFPELIAKVSLVTSKIIGKSPYDTDELMDVTRIFNKIESFLPAIKENNLLHPDELCELIYAKAFSSYVAQDYGNALKYTKKIVLEYGDSNISAVRAFVLKARIITAGSLVLTDKIDESVTIFDQIFKEYKDSSYLQERKTIAFGFSIVAQIAQSQSKEVALDFFQKSLQFAGNSPDKEMRLIKIRVLVNMAICLEMLGNGEKTIEYLDQAIDCARGDNTGYFDITVVSAYFNKAYKYFELKNYEESISIYKRLINDFNHNKNIYVQGTICNSYNSIGLILLKTGKILESKREFEKSLTITDNGKTHFQIYRVVSFIGSGAMDKAIEMVDKLKNLPKWELILLDENISNFSPEIDVSIIRGKISALISSL